MSTLFGFRSDTGFTGIKTNGINVLKGVRLVYYLDMKDEGIKSS